MSELPRTRYSPAEDAKLHDFIETVDEAADRLRWSDSEYDEVLDSALRRVRDFLFDLREQRHNGGAHD